ncbi:hypothetical protein HELRODRAFT_161529 [Helobdella robusta]|uniref:SUEL-type lectin domain-containing protein n=1 Tax=Helobdella robusta TaxID=6412 RepID=T1ERL4_HELRO|nr:hypothetical protein HELRODRAFT_161529 [Helobdella robusta]ESO02278.1 hypothetical protein HELRODRAFT_161529 [Helobdella robusta]
MKRKVPDMPAMIFHAPKIIFLHCFILSFGVIYLQTNDHISYYGTSEEAYLSAAICHTEYFTVKCELDEMIVILNALYGRMRISRCVHRDFGYLGCNNDVTGQMDAFCSGRRNCHLRVLDDTFPNVPHCHFDLNSYLEIDFKCVKASPGQHFEVSIINFFKMNSTTSSHGHSSSLSSVDLRGFGQFFCHAKYGLISEGDGADDGVYVCGDQNLGKKYSIYESSMNFLKIILLETHVRHAKSARRSPYLLQVQGISTFIKNEQHRVVVGCPDEWVPEGGWMVRNEKTILFGCNYTSISWKLTCVGHEWMGPRWNCSYARSFDLVSNLSDDQMQTFIASVGRSLKSF